MIAQATWRNEPAAQEGSQLGRAVGRLHESTTALLAIVIGVHVAAALVHLVVYRDEVMRRMLPGRAG